MGVDLERRAREVRSRAVVRAWEYRQRNLSRGVWYRFRRLLVDARECWEISASEAERLVVEGYEPDPVGSELQPPKQVFVVGVERCSAIEDRRQLDVRLSSELLAATHLVLVPFESR